MLTQMLSHFEVWQFPGQNKIKRHLAEGQWRPWQPCCHVRYSLVEWPSFSGGTDERCGEAPGLESWKLITNSYRVSCKKCRGRKNRSDWAVFEQPWERALRISTNIHHSFICYVFLSWSINLWELSCFNSSFISCEAMLLLVVLLLFFFFGHCYYYC